MFPGDLESALQTVGLIGLLAIVFAESGLLIGFFLPGDSLLFTAGLLSSQGHLAPLPVILVGCFLAAVAGDQVGYAFGARVGPSLFRRPDSRIFKQEYVEKARAVLREARLQDDRAGPVRARSCGPSPRSWPGWATMQYRTFVTFNVLGGLLWAVGVTSLGYILGESVPGHRQVPPAGHRPHRRCCRFSRSSWRSGRPAGSGPARTDAGQVSGQALPERLDVEVVPGGVLRVHVGRASRAGSG